MPPKFSSISMPLSTLLYRPPREKTATNKQNSSPKIIESLLFFHTYSDDIDSRPGTETDKAKVCFARYVYPLRGPVL